MIKVNQNKVTALNNQQRIAELKESLSATDHKEFPSYAPKEGEDLSAVIAQRVAWRAEIRQLQNDTAE